MSYRDWYVGMKVVCVDADFTETDGSSVLKVGYIYEITWIGEITYRHYYKGRYRKDVIGIHVNGLRGAGYVPFSARRFRPVKKRKTNISIFTAMLHGSPLPAKREVA